MDIQTIKDNIVVNVYYIDSNRKVPLHKHDKHDEVFYCVKGEGHGVLGENKVELSAGKVFVVPAGGMHKMVTTTNIIVCSFLVPTIE